jgi:hypothetical protein
MADKYPDGKLTESDEGELEFKIGVFEERVIMDWGKPVKWIALRPAEARTIAASLIKKAEAAEQQLKKLKS